MTTDQESATARFDPTQAPPAVPVTVTALRRTVSLLEGGGGNVTASAGPDGTFLVDLFYEAMWCELSSTLAEMGPGPIRFTAITHWHPDHVGNTENLARAGAVVLGHENARSRSGAAQQILEAGVEVPAAVESARPSLTSPGAVTVHLNGERIEVIPLPPSHSDSDAFVVFHEANVIAAGDVFVNGVYPLINTNGGGSIDATIAEVRHLLALTDDRTIVVPGHGPLGDATAVAAYLDMLVTVRDRTAHAAEGGRPLAEVLAARPSAEFDGAYGAGMISPDTLVTSIVRSLSGSRS